MGDLGPKQVQLLELGQPLEVHQPGLGDLGALHQVQILELGQPFEVHQPGVGDLSVPQAQLLELDQPLEMHQPGVGVHHDTDTIKVASFNIQVFGTSKLKKLEVMDILAKVVRRFDVMAMQEVRSKDQTVLPQFVELINAEGRAVKILNQPTTSHKTGPSSSRATSAAVRFLLMPTGVQHATRLPVRCTTRRVSGWLCCSP